jgi:hypothetical protein
MGAPVVVELSELHRALLRRVAGDVNGARVADLVMDVAAELGADLDGVTAGMWDLVERGDIDYGANARVTVRS